MSPDGILFVSTLVKDSRTGYVSLRTRETPRRFLLERDAWFSAEKLSEYAEEARAHRRIVAKN